MRHRTYRYVAALTILILLFCSCGQNASASDLKGENMTEKMTEYQPAKVIGPVVEATLENQIAGAQKSYENVCDSYAKMQELAASESASKKGKEAASAVEKEYADRIAELADADFSQMTSEELLSLSMECTDMLSAIRKARDVLTLNK